MSHCWALEPKDRPCFSKLVAFMEYQLSDVEDRVFKSLIMPKLTCSVTVILSPHTTDGFNVFLQLYYNVEGQKNGDSVYQNAPLTSEPQEIVKEDVRQSSVTDSEST